jgi:hypothetical protein
MYDGRTLHSREVLQRLVEGWGDTVFHTVIRRTVKFSESTTTGTPITSYASTRRGRGVPPAGPGGAGAVPGAIGLTSPQASHAAGSGDVAGAGVGEFAVHLDNFAGPFDLLLRLIAKHELDITEVGAVAGDRRVPRLRQGSRCRR